MTIVGSGSGLLYSTASSDAFNGAVDEVREEPAVGWRQRASSPSLLPLTAGLPAGPPRGGLSSVQMNFALGSRAAPASSGGLALDAQSRNPRSPGTPYAIERTCQDLKGEPCLAGHRPHPLVTRS